MPCRVVERKGPEHGGKGASNGEVRGYHWSTRTGEVRKTRLDGVLEADTAQRHNTTHGRYHESEEKKRQKKRARIGRRSEGFKRLRTPTADWPRIRLVPSLY